MIIKDGSLIVDDVLPPVKEGMSVSYSLIDYGVGTYNILIKNNYGSCWGENIIIK